MRGLLLSAVVDPQYSEISVVCRVPGRKPEDEWPWSLQRIGCTENEARSLKDKTMHVLEFESVSQELPKKGGGSWNKTTLISLGGVFPISKVQADPKLGFKPIDGSR